jgi:hypothetical protein
MAKNKNGNNINLEIGINQKGNIKVHTQIINDLSSGIYSSPASCIKELINNSYDADAEEVVIRVKPIEDSITIIDNGNGMNAIDFDDNFAWISKSNKRNYGQVSKKMKRPLIGKIGIGFIAVNEICDQLEVISTKEGEPFKFSALISFKNFREADVNVDGGIIKGAYELTNEEEDKKEHYTIIRLLGLKESVKDILDDRQYLADIIRSERKDFDKTYFENMKDLLLFHYKKNLKSFTEDNAYLQFIIDLASYIPVEYIDGGPIESSSHAIISEIVTLHKSLSFKVDLDGIYLKKPIFFPKNREILTKVITFNEKIDLASSTISFRGYFYIHHGLLIPRELNGVSIRIRNIPIAERFGYDPTFMRYPNYMDQLFQNWISGEIYIDQGLEEAMNIDRKSFRVTHPDYLALQNWLHQYLRQKVFKIANEIYVEGREVKSAITTKKDQEEKRRILKTPKVTYSRVITKPTKAGSSQISPINIIKKNKNNTVVEVNESLVKKFKKKDWEVLENVFLIFELAIQESKGDIDKLKILFYQKINDWKETK